MAIVFIPSLMQGLTDGENRVEIEGATVRQIINNLDARYPGLKDRLVENNRVKPNVSVAIDGEVTTLGMLGKVSGEQRGPLPARHRGAADQPPSLRQAQGTL